MPMDPTAAVDCGVEAQVLRGLQCKRGSGLPCGWLAPDLEIVQLAMCGGNM